MSTETTDAPAKGDMSLIGPRPLLVEYLPRYSPQQARRHEVRPGVTGLAQVSGRNGLSWEDKFALDVEYVDRRSLRLDLSIMARTVSGVTRYRCCRSTIRITWKSFRIFWHALKRIWGVNQFNG